MSDGGAKILKLTYWGSIYLVVPNVPTLVRQASMCKVLKLLMSFMKNFVSPEKSGKKVMNQSISLKKFIGKPYSFGVRVVSK